MATPLSFPLVRAVLLSLAVAACNALFYSIPCQARNGDDWVLVERFQSQLKKAQAGNAPAMFEVGRMYELGRGTEPNMQHAIQWYEHAMKKGQNNARAQLGVVYLEGSGVKRDLHKAMILLNAAAKAGSATAQYYLGQMYERGEGLQRNLNLALHWYKKAADNGHYLAIDRLKTLQRTSVSTRQTRTVTSTSPRSESPATVLLQTIMNAKWQHHGRPTGFLPSANTTCSKHPNQVVTCESGEQKRNIGNAIITYVSQATLSGFTNSDQFQVKYFNNVHKVQPVARPSLDGETTAPRAPPNIKLGKQLMAHKLRCELQSIDKLVCTKDNNGSNDTYTRVK